MNRRAGAGSSGPALDPRLLLIGGVLVIGAVVLVVVLLFGGGGGQRVGTRMPDEGQLHVAQGTMPTYESRPATSGDHWNVGGGVAPMNWGVYQNPVPEPAVVHNLEHGGIVIWYQPAEISEEDLATLTDYVREQITTARFKVILSPWNGEDFGHPIAATAWHWRLFQDAADVDQLDAFLDDHYGDAPEPFGGPGQPTG